MSLNEVLEEIRPGCTRRRRSSEHAPEKKPDDIAFVDSNNGELTDEPNTGTEEASSEEQPKRRRRRRMSTNPKCDETPVDTCRQSTDRMYTYVVLGDVHIQGYDLLPGEKLVIAKLTPLVIGK